MQYRAKRTVTTREKDVKQLGNGDDFSQIYDSLPFKTRCTCIALLSDIDRNYITTLGVPEHGPVRCGHCVFGTGLHHSEKAGRIRRRLGNSHHSVVGEFLVPGTTAGAVMAVKRIAAKPREPFFLDMFRNGEMRPDCIPLFVYENAPEIEYGIGTPLFAGIGASALQMRRILSDVITASAWLRERRVVHRDIRCENNILVNSRAVLIDFDAAFFRDWSLPTISRGGKLCVPP